MTTTALDDAIQNLGPLPAAFRFAVDVSYAHLRSMIANVRGVSQYSVRTYRSIVHDHTWITAREVLSEVPACRFIPDAGTEILRYSGQYLLQIHKVDELMRICGNDTKRPMEIEAQGHLWQLGALPRNGDVWLTIGHQPNQFTHVPDNVIVGVAIDGGVTQYRHIELDLDLVASIGPQAADAVERYKNGTGA